MKRFSFVCGFVAGYLSATKKPKAASEPKVVIVDSRSEIAEMFARNEDAVLRILKKGSPQI